MYVTNAQALHICNSWTLILVLVIDSSLQLS